MKVEVFDRRTVYDGFVRLEEARLRHERFDGTMGDEITRVNVDRGDSAAAVVLNLDTDAVILTEQFRYPALAQDGGWILELPAGSVDTGEDPAETMKRELTEEGEDIRAVELPVSQIGDAVARGRVNDAKTLVGLLWLSGDRARH